jgi:hypothetical protein
MQAIHVFVLGVSLLALPAWGQEAKPAEQKLDIGKMTCKELMAGNDTDREVGLAYFHGFVAGTKNQQNLDINATAAQTDRVKDYCLSNPTSTVLDAFAKTVK